VDVRRKNNVNVVGAMDGPTVMLAHGFGCDQNLWRFVTERLAPNFRVVLFDHVGSGASDPSAWDAARYGSLSGYASDVLDIVRELDLDDVIFVGHSVAAMMGIIAANKAPDLFSKLVLVGPSPYYINEGDYQGGFTHVQIDELLEALENNHLGWSMAMAPVIMGNPGRKELAGELENSFCRTDPEIARQFARTTFLSDAREALPTIHIPTLILQCSEDVIAPRSVGEYVHEQIAGSKIVYMKATGHCPNLSAPDETIEAIKTFLA